MFLVRPAILLVAAFSILFAAYPVGSAQTSAVGPSESVSPILHIDRHDAKLAIAGHVSSTAHAAILRNVARQLFPSDEHDINVSHHASVPPGWALMSELTLRAMSVTYSSTATMDANNINVKGYSTNMEQWRADADRLRKNLLPGMQFTADIIEVQPTESSQGLCSAVFNAALRNRRISFAMNSNELASTAFALLDELIEISADCPQARILVTGHTDASGDEAINIRLSEARAAAVVDYMVAHGISASRFAAAGVGSRLPLLSGNSSRARELNRRIEVELEFQ